MYVFIAYLYVFLPFLYPLGLLAHLVTMFIIPGIQHITRLDPNSSCKALQIPTKTVPKNREKHNLQIQKPETQSPKSLGTMGSLDRDPLETGPSPGQVLEHVFVVIFAAELVYRIYKIRWEYARHWAETGDDPAKW